MHHRPRHRTGGLAALVGCTVLSVALLSGCASESDYTGSGDWVVQNEPQAPIMPQPETPGGSGSTTPDEPQSEGSLVRAIDLDQPIAITALPDGTALVGERVSGKITQVFPEEDKKQKALYTIPDVDGSAGGGLLALAASPKYYENALVYAFITTKDDGRVISLNTKGVPKPVLTGLPKAPAALAFGPDGSLLVAVGGTEAPYGGKVLAIDNWGDPGPAATEGITMAQGVARPAGLCTNGVDTFVVNAGVGDPGALTGNSVYRLPKPGEDTGGLTGMKSIVTYGGDTGGASGCVATEVELTTAATDAESLIKSVFSQDGTIDGAPVLDFTGEYGRLRGIALDQINGGMWVTTYNTDGIGDPADDDDKVLYLKFDEAGGSGNVS